MSTKAVAIIEQPAPTVVCAKQNQIEISFDERGNAELRQTCWPDEDQTIHISRDNIQTFLDALCDALGILSVRP
jgi:hypothetical protein